MTGQTSSPYSFPPKSNLYSFPPRGPNPNYFNNDHSNPWRGPNGDGHIHNGHHMRGPDMGKYPHQYSSEGHQFQRGPGTGPPEPRYFHHHGRGGGGKRRGNNHKGFNRQQGKVCFEF